MTNIDFRQRYFPMEEPIFLKMGIGIQKRHQRRWELMGRDVAVLTGDELIRNANLIRTIW